MRRGLGLHEHATPACGAKVTAAAALAAVAALRDKVQTLVQQDRLTQAEAHAIGVKLGAAARLLRRGQSSTAANVLHAFENQVRALARSHRLSTSDRQSLVDATACLINGLES